MIRAKVSDAAGAAVSAATLTEGAYIPCPGLIDVLQVVFSTDMRV